MHWAVYRHHPQGGLADHHCLFERAGLITQPECHWGGLISQLALVYNICTCMIISEQQLLSYYPDSTKTNICTRVRTAQMTKFSVSSVSWGPTCILRDPHA